MLYFCLRRLMALMPVALGVVTLVALLIHAVPGDPVERILGDYATKEQKERLRTDLGLDKPVSQQLLHYYQGLVKGDLGHSLLKGQQVTELISERLRPTVELALLAIMLAISISLPLGILSALKAGTIVDYLTMGLALLGVATPTFWLGSMLILIFSLKLDYLPVSGRGELTTYILPMITLGTPLAAILCRMTRNSLLDTLHENYVRTARAKGLGEVTVILKHVLRNAALPLVTIIGLQLGAILTGAVITEMIFDWPGLGTLMLEAVNGRDYPLIQGCVLWFAAIYLVVNLATDILYALVDPRIKMGAK